MLYLFCGDDTEKRISGYEKFIKSMSKDTEIFFVNHNNFSTKEIENFYSGSSLFFDKCVVVFSSILDREENSDFILEKLGLMAYSCNSFVFFESKLNKPILDLFKKFNAVVNQFLLTKERKERFNNFLLANTFSDKNKLGLWINFRLAVDKGVGLEELVGVLFWKIKDMLFKRNFKKFSKGELEKFAARLSYLLPQARRDGMDAELVFEHFILKMF